MRQCAATDETILPFDATTKKTIAPSRIALVISLTSFRGTFGERTEMYSCLTSVECRTFGEHISEVFAS